MLNENRFLGTFRGHNTRTSCGNRQSRRKSHALDCESRLEINLKQMTGKLKITKVWQTGLFYMNRSLIEGES